MQPQDCCGADEARGGQAERANNSSSQSIASTPSRSIGATKLYALRANISLAWKAPLLASPSGPAMVTPDSTMVSPGRVSSQLPPVSAAMSTITLPGRMPQLGHRHPLSLIRDEVIDIFTRLGYQVLEGPEIEDDYHNFEALNMPADHPARDMQDTLYLASPLRGETGDLDDLPALIA